MPTREEMRSLAEEIVGSYADRIAGIAELRETVKMDLKGFQDYRIATGSEIRADLARSVTERKHEVADMFKGFDAELIELSRARVAMSKELRADLARSLADCKRSTGAMLKGFNAELKKVRLELAGGRDEWQIMSATMQAHRGGAPVEMKPPVEEIAEEKAAEITPGTGDIRNQVFEYLANHPDGARLVELEQEFGVARIKMARLLKDLMDENKVEKRGLLYFAI